MTEKKLVINYKQYNSIAELDQKDQELFSKAVEATKGSYAPYSNFNVGAAVRMSNGAVVKGANQENAAYPSGLCAERTAIFSAHANFPNEIIEAIALTGAKNGSLMPSITYPCGACRQVMSESQTRAGRPIRIIIGSANKILVYDSVEDILPFQFDNLE